MNKSRRKELQRIIDQLEDLKDNLESIMSEEEDYRDSIPENLQGSARYEKADDACGSLDDAISSLEDAVSSIEEAIE